MTARLLRSSAAILANCLIIGYRSLVMFSVIFSMPFKIHPVQLKVNHIIWKLLKKSEYTYAVWVNIPIIIPPGRRKKPGGTEEGDDLILHCECFFDADHGVSMTHDIPGSTAWADPLQLASMEVVTGLAAVDLLPQHGQALLE